MWVFFFLQESIAFNQQLFLDVFWAVACFGHIQPKTSSLRDAILTSERVLSNHMSKMIALTLVDLVAPDVMFNGIPWPDQEFTKSTIER